jgi:hypothetical protein
MPGTDRWQRVGHLPGAILINTGEILSMWTDKKYLPLVSDQKCNYQNFMGLTIF